MQKPVV